MKDFVHLHFEKIDSQQDYEIAHLSLKRPEKANALNEEMILSLQQKLSTVNSRKTCRLCILKAEGKHFSAGADLNWMKKSATMSYEENLKDAEALAKVFELLANLPMVTLACVHGSSAGGALGLIACCDMVLSTETAKFSLKEVRVGLLPAMILPYLLKKTPLSFLLNQGLTGDTFEAEEALRAGLVTQICKEENFSKNLRKHIDKILLGSPEAQSRFKTLVKVLNEDMPLKMQWTCIEAIAKARTSTEGQKGLEATLRKDRPFWVQQLSEHWEP